MRLLVCGLAPTRATDNPYGHPDNSPYIGGSDEVWYHPVRAAGRRPQGAQVMAGDSPTFGDLLRRYRVAAGLTQEELAERAGISADGIGVLERGRRLAPRRDTLLLLAEALELGERQRKEFERSARRPLAPADAMSRQPVRPGAAVADSAPGAPARNLPIQLSRFIGRRHEVDAVRRLLLQSQVRLLTLTGPGGTGKTRLALEAAEGMVDRFPDGTHFVDLASISDPRLVASAIAQTCGVAEAGSRPLLEVLKQHLRDKSLLLVLDNFEQVTEAAPLIAELLASSQGLKVLATSRSPLHLRGEHEFPVPPLSLPDLALPPRPESLSRYDAVALFVQRARSADPGFELTDESAPAVAEICHRLDGLPLAIELAAARVKLFTPAAMLGRLSNRLRLLTAGARDLPQRQQTLRDAIDWSYRLLDEEERRLFARLAVFAGGWELPAAEAICDPEGELDMIEGVGSLLENSLMRREEGAGEEPRFRMLETIREYALEKLGESGEEDELRRRHAAYYLSLAEEVEPHLNNADRAAWMAQLRAELDNLRAALSWLIDRGDAERGLRLAAALGWFWNYSSLSEGRRWLESTLGLMPDMVDPLVRAKALLAAGMLAWGQGDNAAAMPRLEESATLLRAEGDELRLPTALHFLSMVLLDSDPAQARSLAEEAVSVSRGTTSPFSLGVSLTVLGIVARQQREEMLASSLFEESAAVLRAAGDTWTLTMPLRHLALGAIRSGEYERADQLLTENLSLLRGMGDKAFTSRALEMLATSAAMRGDHPRAARLFGAGEAMRESIGAAVPPSYRADYDRGLAAARSALGDKAFEVGREEGRALPPDQAVEYALGLS